MNVIMIITHKWQLLRKKNVVFNVECIFHKTFIRCMILHLQSSLSRESAPVTCAGCVFPGVSITTWETWALTLTALTCWTDRYTKVFLCLVQENKCTVHSCKNHHNLPISSFSWNSLSQTAPSYEMTTLYVTPPPPSNLHQISSLKHSHVFNN